MTFEQVEAGRSNAAWDILKKFGETIGRAEKSAAEKMQDPAMRKLAAARVSLEYAVIATARERNMPTQTVAGALQGATVAQQAMMIKEGRAALGRAYSVEPDVLVSAFTGKMVEMEMPRGLGSTPALDKMVDAARNLVTGIVKDEYATRGRFDAATSNRDGFVSLKSDSQTAPNKTELASRLVFIESAIDAAVAKGDIAEANARMLKERVEAQVFQPRPPQSIQFSESFRKFFESRGAGMRIEAMKEVRAVTQSSTVKEITQKMMLAMPKAVAQPTAADPARATKALER